MIELMLWLVRLFQRPIRPGDAISLIRKPTETWRYGTFGCLLRWRGDRYLLSCAHVFDAGKPGDLAGLFDVRRKKPARPIGPLTHVSGAHDYALIKVRWTARVKETFPREIGRVDRTPFPIRELKFVPRHELAGRVPVQAIGATSGHTTGFAATGAFSTFNYETGEGVDYVISPPFIEIKPTREKSFHFCRKGDSGALILAMPDRESTGVRSQPLGLLVAVRKDGLGDFGLAVPIERVLDDLSGAELRIGPH